MQNKVWEKAIVASMFLFIVLSSASVVLADDIAKSESDRVITSSVENKLQSDSQLMGARINVDTTGREVTLKGTVNCHADVTRAAQVASSCDGVKQVDNRLKRDQEVSSNGCHYGGSQLKFGCPIGARIWGCN